MDTYQDEAVEPGSVAYADGHVFRLQLEPGQSGDLQFGRSADDGAHGWSGGGALIKPFIRPLAPRVLDAVKVEGSVGQDGPSRFPSVEAQEHSVALPFDERTGPSVGALEPRSRDAAVDDNGRVLAHHRVLRLGRERQIFIASCERHKKTGDKLAEACHGDVIKLGA